MSLLFALCRVSRSSFYRWKNRKGVINDVASAREQLKEKLVKAFVANRRVYGAPRLTHEQVLSKNLKLWVFVSLGQLISRLMVELSITGSCGRAKVVTTRPDRHARKSSDFSST